MATFRVQRETALHPLMYESLKDGDDWSPAIAQMVTDHAALIAAGNGAVGMDFGAPGSVYEISDPFDIGGIPIIGYPEFRPDFISEAVTAAGSLGTYEDLEADAVIGGNRLECAALAPQVQDALDAGTPFTIRLQSDLDFDVYANVKQGEQHSVRNVIGNFIYLNEPLLDTYLASNGARAAIATIAQVIVQGSITVVHSPALSSTETRGVAFTYAHVKGRFDLRRCRSNSSAFINCWAPDVWVDAEDGHAIGATSGLGIGIQDCTMYGTFRGRCSTRGAVNASIRKDATGGPSWENHVVGVIGTSLAGNVAIFGAHSHAGSIYYEGCTAIGGGALYDIDGDPMARPAGFQSGARRTYFKGITAIRCGVAVSIRGESEATPDREEFIVDGMHLVDCEYGLNKGGDTGHMDRLVVRNVTGTMSNLETSAINILVGDIDEWEFDNIYTAGGRLLNIGNNVADVPATVRVNNFRCKGDATTADTDIRGVSVGTGGDVTRVELLNGVIDGMYYGLRSDKTGVTFILESVDLLNNLQHLIVPDATTVTHFKMRSGSARGSRHGSGSQGVVAINGSGAVGILDIDGVEVDGDNYFVGASNAVTTAIIGTLKTHSGYLGHIRNAASPLLYVLSGSQGRAFALAGYGDPDGVVSARLGCDFTRLDGAAGTLRYVNDDGSTGWTAYA